MAYDGAASIYAVRLRVARLNSAGETPASAASMYVTDSLVRIEFTPEYDSSTEITRKNGNGDLCVNVPAKRRLKQITIGALVICTNDPELEELLAGGTILTNSGATVGYQSPAIGQDATPNGVSIEAWSRAIIGGAPAATNPFIRWVFPRVYLSPGATALEENAADPSFSGYANENPSWGNGPANDWTFDSGRAYQRARVATLPAVTAGVVAVPVQTP